MRKNLRSAAFVAVLCLGGTVSAQDTTVQTGKDGVKVRSGETRVETGRDGRVIIRTPNVQVETDASEGDSDTAVVTTESDSEIELTGSGQRKTFTCKGDTRVEITGSSNEYVFKGECKRVEVTGSANKVTLEAVGRLEVTGMGNAVTWQRAVGDAKKPKISNSGMNNTVSQAK